MFINCVGPLFSCKLYFTEMRRLGSKIREVYKLNHEFLHYEHLTENIQKLFRFLQSTVSALTYEADHCHLIVTHGQITYLLKKLRWISNIIQKQDTGDIRHVLLFESSSTRSFTQERFPKTLSEYFLPLQLQYLNPEEHNVFQSRKDLMIVKFKLLSSLNDP